jgi:hypothetical protein
MPSVGFYEVEVGNMANNKITGGAPNNFLLMRNEKHVAPFNSTVSRFK